jgi:hypothetical protein
VSGDRSLLKVISEYANTPSPPTISHTRRLAPLPLRLAVSFDRWAAAVSSLFDTQMAISSPISGSIKPSKK